MESLLPETQRAVPWSVSIGTCGAAWGHKSCMRGQRMAAQILVWVDLITFNRLWDYPERRFI